MTKLLRNGVLIAEGKAIREPGDDVTLFLVSVWHVTDPGAFVLHRDELWCLDDGKRQRTFAGELTNLGVSTPIKGVSVVRTMEIAASVGEGSLDVRDDPDA